MKMRNMTTAAKEARAQNLVMEARECFLSGDPRADLISADIRRAAIDGRVDAGSLEGFVAERKRATPMPKYSPPAASPAPVKENAIPKPSAPTVPPTPAAPVRESVSPRPSAPSTAPTPQIGGKPALSKAEIIRREGLADRLVESDIVSLRLLHPARAQLEYEIRRGVMDGRVTEANLQQFVDDRLEAFNEVLKIAAQDPGEQSELAKILAEAMTVDEPAPTRALPGLAEAFAK